MVAHCRGSSSRQALVPHLVLFSSCQGHDDDGYDDYGDDDVKDNDDDISRQP